MAGMWLYADKQQELHKYTVLGCVESGLRKASNYSVKALVLAFEMLGFTVWNGPNQDLKPMLLQTEGINFEKCK